ncbi:MAG: methionyl-tRNA formyltransferase [Prevotella sp.]|nr:methionyl-tRNA formyltransferase [Prevotella sp.]
MKKEDLRIVFMGTPEFAVGTLQALLEGGYNVVAIVTQPDKAVGRHHDTLQAPEVKRYALEHGFKEEDILQPVKMKDEEFVERLRSYHADLQIVVAFRMLPEVVWAMPRFGTFNVHAALLPQYRGAAPINWAVINGETLTGVTTFFLDKDIDTGRIIMQEAFDIQDDYNVEDVYDGLMKLGAGIAIKTIDKIIEGDGQVESMAQESLISSGKKLYGAPKIFKETCEINWTQPGKKVYDFVRGLSPYPGAWTTFVSKEGKETVMKVFQTAKTTRGSIGEPGTIVVENGRMFVTTEDGMLELLEVQMTGKKRMKVKDFLNGNRNVQEGKVK